jgi:hypothetical protein
VRFAAPQHLRSFTRSQDFGKQIEFSMFLTCPRSFYQAKLRNSVQNNTSVCPFAAI